MISFILLGATGDIYKKKVFPSIQNINNNNTHFILVSRKNTTSDIPNSDIIKFDYDNLNSYNQLLSLCKDEIIIYCGVSSDISIKFYNNFSKITNNVKYIFEKPFGNKYDTFISYINLLNNNNTYYFLDHYLFKSTFIFLPPYLIFDNIKNINISLMETDDVEHRLDYFDKYGLFIDMFQSHICSILLKLLNNNLSNFNELNLQSINTATYNNYSGNPNTETYFNLTLSYQKIIIYIECAKKWPENKKCIDIHYNNNIFRHWDIFSNPNDYNHLFNGFISKSITKYFLDINTQKYFWKLTDHIKSNFSKQFTY